MKIKHKPLSLSMVMIFLTSCLTPQTYFSEIFNLAYETYQPIKNTNQLLSMNYQVDVTVLQDNETYIFEAYFFETGFQVIKDGPALVNDQTTREYLSTLFDYAAEGVFEDQSFANNPNVVQKRFVSLTQEEIEGYGSAVTMVESMLTEDVRETLNSRVTDLLIGGQPATLNEVTYSLPLADFLSFAELEDFVGFLPTSVDNEITYTKSTKALTLELLITNETDVFEVTLSLSNPGSLIARDYLLTEEQKRVYTGYTA